MDSLTEDLGTEISPTPESQETPTQSGEDADEPLPPRLEVLADSTRSAWDTTLGLSRLACEHLLSAAASVSEARGLCPAEDWPGWLKGAGIPALGVSRLLEIHRVALDWRAMDQLGGVPLSALWAEEVCLPGEGEVLAVTLGEWLPGAAVPVAYVWRAPEAPSAFCAGRLDLNSPADGDRVTHHPLASERDLWATVWHLLDHRFSEMIFRPIRATDDLVGRLETRRRAVIKANARVVH